MFSFFHTKSSNSRVYFILTVYHISDTQLSVIKVKCNFTKIRIVFNGIVFYTACSKEFDLAQSESLAFSPSFWAVISGPLKHYA